MRILVKVGEMRFHHLHVHPISVVLMALSGCCCWSKGTLSTITVDLVETMLFCLKHSQKESSESFFLLPVKAADSGSRKSTQYKNRYHCCVFEASKRLQSHSSCSVYSQLNEELRVTLAFTSWQNKPPSSPALISPGGRWCSPPLMAAHVSSCLQNTWMLPHNQRMPHWNRPETNLKPEHSLKPLS